MWVHWFDENFAGRCSDSGFVRRVAPLRLASAFTGFLRPDWLCSAFAREWRIVTRYRSATVAGSNGLPCTCEGKKTRMQASAPLPQLLPAEKSPHKPHGTKNGRREGARRFEFGVRKRGISCLSPLSPAARSPRPHRDRGRVSPSRMSSRSMCSEGGSSMCFSTARRIGRAPYCGS